MPGATILINDVGFAYGRGPLVLRDVSLAVAAGAVTALVGRSGSGKSSLLHVVAGLVRPRSGQVVIDGALVAGPSPRAVMMFQSPSLFPWLTVAQNVALGLRFARIRRAEITRRVDAALALVGLQAEAGSRATAISGGQAQRAALARALVMEPDVLLLDEPFAALDLFTRLSLQRDVRAIATRLGVTVLLVSHDIAEIAAMADQAAFLAGKPARIVAETRVSDAARTGVDTPAARAEIARLTALYETASSGQPAPRPAAPALVR
jgi:NitT/TauT family transport system ATP-binding protein